MKPAKSSDTETRRQITAKTPACAKTQNILKNGGEKSGKKRQNSLAAKSFRGKPHCETKQWAA